eukprot:TRINITY_DN6549_c0_g1_i1.p1 TRINITY_DN6549_c0_g1~~TRINITY_DN6549_c0_g1_i1.p1  ORF type:complete len:647 (-),score=128.49 TRINITY_DN6549_c0_g1_i1:25-1965(-)
MILEDEESWLKEEEEAIFEVSRQHHQKSESSFCFTSSSTSSTTLTSSSSKPDTSSFSFLSSGPANQQSVRSPILTQQSTTPSPPSHDEEVDEETELINKKRKATETLQQSLLRSPSSASNNAPPKRRIPGPAGSITLIKRDKDSLLSDKDGLSHQLNGNTNSFRFFVESSPWVAMMVHHQLYPFGTLKLKYSVDYALKRTYSTKIPELIVLLKTLRASEGDMIASLVDPTGEIEGVIHKYVIEQNSTTFTPGAVVVLTAVTVFSAAEDRKYLNITADNISKIFDVNTAAPSNQEPTLSTMEPTDLYDIEEQIPERTRRSFIRSPFLPKGRPKQTSKKTINPRPSPKTANPNHVSINNPYNKPSRPTPPPSPKTIVPKALAKTLPPPLPPNQSKISFDVQKRPTTVPPTSPASSPSPVLSSSSSSPSPSPVLNGSTPKTTTIFINRPPQPTPPLFGVTPVQNAANHSTPPLLSPNLVKGSAPPPVSPTLSTPSKIIPVTVKTIPVNLQRFLPSQQSKAAPPPQQAPLPVSTSVPTISRPQLTSPISNNNLPQSISAPALSLTNDHTTFEDDIPSVMDEFGEHHHISEYDEEEGESEDYFADRYDQIVARESRAPEVTEEPSLLDDDLDDVLATIDERVLTNRSSSFG